MSILLDNEISRARAEALREGYTKATLDQWSSMATALLARIGFSCAAEVRRLADKYGRRPE